MGDGLRLVNGWDTDEKVSNLLEVQSLSVPTNLNHRYLLLNTLGRQFSPQHPSIDPWHRPHNTNMLTYIRLDIRTIHNCRATDRATSDIQKHVTRANQCSTELVLGEAINKNDIG